VVSLTFFLASLLTFLGSIGGTNSPSTSSLAGFQIDPCAVLVFGAGSLLLPPLVVAREGSLGAHDRPIGAAVSDITGLPLRALLPPRCWIKPPGGRGGRRAGTRKAARRRGGRGDGEGRLRAATLMPMGGERGKESILGKDRAIWAVISEVLEAQKIFHGP